MAAPKGPIRDAAEEAIAAATKRPRRGRAAGASEAELGGSWGMSRLKAWWTGNKQAASEAAEAATPPEALAGRPAASPPPLPASPPPSTTTAYDTLRESVESGAYDKLLKTAKQARARAADLEGRAAADGAPDYLKRQAAAARREATAAEEAALGETRAAVAEARAAAGPRPAQAHAEGGIDDLLSKPFTHVESTDAARTAWKAGPRTTTHEGIDTALNPNMWNRLGSGGPQHRLVETETTKVNGETKTDAFFELLYSGARQGDLLREAMMNRFGKTFFDLRQWWREFGPYTARSAARTGRDAKLGLYNDQLGAAIQLLDDRKGAYGKELARLGLNNTKTIRATYNQLTEQFAKKLKDMGLDTIEGFQAKLTSHAEEWKKLGFELDNSQTLKANYGQLVEHLSPFKTLKDLRADIDEYTPNLIRSVRENLFSREEWMGRRTFFQKTMGLGTRFLQWNLYKDTWQGITATAKGNFAEARDAFARALVQDLYGGIRRNLQGFAWNANRQENGVFIATIGKPLLMAANLWAFWLGPVAAVQEAHYRMNLSKDRASDTWSIGVPYVRPLQVDFNPRVPFVDWRVNTNAWVNAARIKRKVWDPSEEQRVTAAIEDGRKLLLENEAREAEKAREREAAKAAKGPAAAKAPTTIKEGPATVATQELEAAARRFQDGYSRLERGDDSLMKEIQEDLKRRGARLNAGGLTQPTNKEIDRHDELLSLLRQPVPPITSDASEQKAREDLLKAKRNATLEFARNPVATMPEIAEVLDQKKKNPAIAFNKKVNEMRDASAKGIPDLNSFMQALTAELPHRGSVVDATSVTTRERENALEKAIKAGGPEAVQALKDAYTDPTVSHRTLGLTPGWLSIGLSKKTGRAPAAPHAPVNAVPVPVPASPKKAVPKPTAPATTKPQERADAAPKPNDPDRRNLAAKTPGAPVPQPT